MHPFLVPLNADFRRHANTANAAGMRAYMKDHFPFFGIKVPERRALMKAHLAVHGTPAIDELPAIARSAFAQPEREMHQVAIDLLVKQAKKLGPEQLPLLEELVTTQSWWDSVDPLAVHMAGTVLKSHPAAIEEWNARWVESEDLWLNRTSILFQNRWKKDTDQALLFANIDRHAGHKDFFIRKAIGWALRELGKTDPGAVLDFVRSRKLSPLSEREAVRNL
ncbi:MAG: DNA alkylation repair protein [Flavobacteriales bacterium]|nr:DNA alkylation repair protein [Flavobacteriales bacterium]MBP9081016.1 DNA alkylation repair protein [Flavobacteriales bacterium]